MTEADDTIEFEISDPEDHPVPPSTRGGFSKYPLSRLKPGQSFFVPTKDLGEARRLRNSVGHVARKAKIPIRQVPVTEKKGTRDQHGLRVWRLHEQHAPVKAAPRK